VVVRRILSPGCIATKSIITSRIHILFTSQLELNRISTKVPFGSRVAATEESPIAFAKSFFKFGRWTIITTNNSAGKPELLFEFTRKKRIATCSHVGREWTSSRADEDALN
jgi:hypothetical protein